MSALRQRSDAPENRLDATGRGLYACYVEKKTARMLKKLEKVRGLSEDERYLFARSLAATPDERWQFHVNFLRSHGLYSCSDRKKFGFK